MMAIDLWPENGERVNIQRLQRPSFLVDDPHRLVRLVIWAVMIARKAS